MYWFISKKELANYLNEIKQGSRKENLYAKYPPDNREQEDLNLYSQGFEDGSDNAINGIFAHFHIYEKRNW